MWMIIIMNQYMVDLNEQIQKRICCGDGMKMKNKKNEGSKVRILDHLIYVVAIFFVMSSLWYAYIYKIAYPYGIDNVETLNQALLILTFSVYSMLFFTFLLVFAIYKKINKNKRCFICRA